MRTIIAGSMALALLACSAQDKRPPQIEVRDGWTREIAPGQSAAALYLTIANKGEGGDRLVSVESAQGLASLHTTSSAGGVARMRPLGDGLEIGPQATVELKPGGTHIMLTGLSDRLSNGQTIQLTLGFERSGKRPATIRVVGAGDDGHSGHGMKM